MALPDTGMKRAELLYMKLEDYVQRSIFANTGHRLLHSKGQYPPF